MPALGLLRGEEAQDLGHQTLSLIRRENELRVGGAFEYHQLFRVRGFLILLANSGEPQSGVVRVVAAYDEQLPALYLFGFFDRRVRQQRQAIYLAGLRLDRRIRSSPASKTCPDDRHGLCAILTKVSDCRQHIEARSVVIRVGRGAAARLTSPAKINGQNAKPRFDQYLCLFLPTLLCETASVRQHYSSVAFSIQVGVDKPAVLGRKGNLFRRFRSGLPSACAAESERRYRNCQYDVNDLVLHCFVPFRELFLLQSPASFGDQTHGGPAHEILFVKPLAPCQRRGVVILALQLVTDEPHEFSQRRADVR